MNRITESMRMCLVERSGDLQHFLRVGIDDADWYRNACECFCLLNSIDEEERTDEELSQLNMLLELTDKYEEQHYEYRN